MYSSTIVMVCECKQIGIDIDEIVFAAIKLQLYTIVHIHTVRQAN